MYDIFLLINFCQIKTKTLLETLNSHNMKIRCELLLEKPQYLGLLQANTQDTTPNAVSGHARRRRLLGTRGQPEPSPVRRGGNAGRWEALVPLGSPPSAFTWHKNPREIQLAVDLPTRHCTLRADSSFLNLFQLNSTAKIFCKFTPPQNDLYTVLILQNITGNIFPFQQASGHIDLDTTLELLRCGVLRK